MHSWFYEQQRAEGGQYAQVRGDSASQGFRDVYRRCIATFFSSARASAPDARLCLWLNVDWDPTSSKVAAETLALLDRLGVERTTIAYSYMPPATWPSAWRNQFFVFDVVAVIAETCLDDDLHIVLDSDVIWAGGSRLEQMWQAIAAEGGLVYEIGYGPDREINGFTRRQLTSLSDSLGHGVEGVLPYYGGEFLALRGDKLKELSLLAGAVWPTLLSRHDEGEPVMTEEAHLLSLLYAALGTAAPADRYVQRIWTQVGKYRNVRPEWLELVLWHVPAEKRYGIPRLYRRLIRSGQLLWPAPPAGDWRAATAALVGIPDNGPVKVVLDLAQVARTRALGALGGARP